MELRAFQSLFRFRLSFFCLLLHLYFVLNVLLILNVLSCKLKRVLDLYSEVFFKSLHSIKHPKDII